MGDLDGDTYMVLWDTDLVNGLIDEEKSKDEVL